MTGTGRRALVIGYGNELRGDDALGRRAAAAVARWRVPGVAVISVHQLTPELAEPIAAATTAVFLDAHPAERDARLRVQPVSPSTADPANAHIGDPARLLGWADRWFGRVPAAWWITMPAADFTVGAPLSSVGKHALRDGLRALRVLLILSDTTFGSSNERKHTA